MGNDEIIWARFEIGRLATISSYFQFIMKQSHIIDNPYSECEHDITDGTLNIKLPTHLTFTCSKPKLENLEKSVKYVQSYNKLTIKH